jgi:hypothetical protein
MNKVQLTITADDLDESTYDGVLRAFRAATQSGPFFFNPDDFFYDNWIIQCTAENLQTSSPTHLLRELVIQIRQDVPIESMTQHLLTALEDAESHIDDAFEEVRRQQEAKP